MPSKYSIFLVALVLGLLLVFQFRTSTLPPSNISSDRVQGLTMELKDVTLEKENLKAEVRALSERLNAALQGSDEAKAALLKEIERNKVIACVTPVEGPGIELILRNPPRGEGVDKGYLFTVRDEDLLRAVNELRAAGAEAVAVNSQRLTATSQIRSAGSFINVNMSRITPPYHIHAIGDPQALEAALEMTDGLAPSLREWGVDVEIKKHQVIEIPGYQGSLTTRFAEPLKDLAPSKVKNTDQG